MPKNPEGQPIVPKKIYCDIAKDLNLDCGFARLLHTINFDGLCPKSPNECWRINQNIIDNLSNIFEGTKPTDEKPVTRDEVIIIARHWSSKK